MLEVNLDRELGHFTQFEIHVSSEGTCLVLYFWNTILAAERKMRWKNPE